MIRAVTKAPSSNLLFTIAWLCLVLAAPSSFAQAFLFQVKNAQTNLGEGAVDLIGTHGFNRIPGTFTDSQGNFSVDPALLSSSPSNGSQPTVIFVKEGFRFDPPEISLTVENCPNHTCSVKAVASEISTVSLEWTVVSNQAGVAGVPVTVPAAYMPCPKLTDPDGYVVFAVDERAGACNDYDASNANDTYTVVLGQPTNQSAPTSCTYAAHQSDNFRVCPHANSVRGASAYCLSAQPPALGSSTTYKLDVKDVTGAAVSGVEFFGDSNITSKLSNRLTNSQGRWQFSTASLSTAPNDVIPPDATIMVMPVAAGYRFEPSQLKLTNGSCPSNTCRFTAWKDPAAQALVRISATANGAAMLGAQVEVTSPNTCRGSQTAFTDGKGTAFVPVLAQSACSDTNNSSVDDWTVVNPNYPGCTFTHQSEKPFNICPTSNVVTVPLVAFCGGSAPPKQLTVRGYVFDADGAPVSSAGVRNGDTEVTTTNADGAYSFLTDENVTLQLSVNKLGMRFDPESVEIVQLSKNFSGLNFQAVIPVSSDSPFDEDECEGKLQPAISGTVYNKLGLPMQGVDIINFNAEDDSGEVVATSGADGKYSFTKPAMTDVGVRPRQTEDYGFNPSTRFFPDNRCDRTEVNFKQVDAPTVTIAGKVLAPVGGGAATLVPLTGALVELSYGSRTLSTYTNAAGYYAFSIPEGISYSSMASYGSLTFSHDPFEDEPLDDQLHNDFIANEFLTPVPTASATNSPTITPTWTATFTPTITPTSAPTATPTKTSAATAVPPATATPTRTSTPTFTKTPTVVPPTHTATPTRTSTATRTATTSGCLCHVPSGHPDVQHTICPGQPGFENHLRNHALDTPGPCGSPPAASTATATPTPSQTPTVSVTLSITSTPTKTAAPTSTPTSTQTPTKTATATATGTATRTPTVTRTPTNSPTATATRVPTATPTETPNPNWKLRLAGVCSENPSRVRNWTVSNTYPVAKTVEWVVYQTQQKGRLTVPALGLVSFSTATVASSSNTTTLFEIRADGSRAQVDARVSDETTCPTPTPTATPTYTPTVTPSPTMTPTGVPTQTSTVTPTATQTPTATPTQPLYVITGSFKNARSSASVAPGSFSNAQKKLLNSVTFYIAARDISDGTIYDWTGKGIQKFKISVPDGKYLVSFSAVGAVVTATSRPLRYSITMKKKQQLVAWDINIRSNSTKLSSSQAAAKLSAIKRSLLRLANRNGGTK